MSVERLRGVRLRPIAFRCVRRVVVRPYMPEQLLALLRAP
jgi:hypothetical protein